MKIHSKENLYGEYTVPSDKSITSRAIVLGCVAKGKTYVVNPQMGGDVTTLISCMKKLGAKIKLKGRILEIKSIKNLDGKFFKLDCGNSGTTMRFLCGLIAGSNSEAVLTGDKSLQQREMRAIQDPFNKMGATISLYKGGRPPVHVTGAQLRPIDYPLNTASSQIKSSILLSALQSGVKATVKEDIQTRNHMEILLKEMGADIEKHPETGIITLNKSEIKGKRLFVCGDFSVAMNFVALGLICGKTVCRNVGINPTRTGVLNVLKRMGAKIEIKNRRILCGEPIADIYAYKSKLIATHVTGDEAIKLTDDIPILAVLMGVAEGESIISELGKVQYKDGDKISIIARMINDVGGKCKKFDGGLVIKGVDRYEGGNVDAQGDARIAMSAVIALSSSKNGGETEDDFCINADFPGFFECLRDKSFVRLSSCSPSDDSNFMHSFILSRLKVKNYTYSYLNVAEGGIKRSYAEAKDFEGFTVSNPYNVEVARRTSKFGHNAKIVRSVDCVKDGIGYSTVGTATAYAIKRGGLEIAGKRVLVCGCGSSAKSIIVALLEEKAIVTVYNRNLKVANEFKRKMPALIVKENLTEDLTFDVVINATPVGGGYHAGVMPMPAKIVEKSSTVVELIAVPENTELVKTAKSADVKVITGKEIAFFNAYLADCIFAEVESSYEQAEQIYSEYIRREYDKIKGN